MVLQNTFSEKLIMVKEEKTTAGKELSELVLQNLQEQGDISVKSID